MLTPTQEDYLETILRIAEEGKPVLITGLAARLGCKLPTVTRTIQKMAKSGYVTHEVRGTVNLTRMGRTTAEHLVQRHQVVFRFLRQVLGLAPEEAETCACQLEHGLSSRASQRLHNWLEHLDALPPGLRASVLQFSGRSQADIPDFDGLPDSRIPGWRG